MSEKIYPRLFTKLFCSPLMLHPPVRASFEAHLLARITGDHSGSAGILPASSDLTPAANAAASTKPQPRNSLGAPPSGRHADDFEDWADWSKSYSEFRQRMRVEAIYKKIGSVAVVSIDGVIDKMLSQFEMDCYGGCDLADVDVALADAATDPLIKTVVLNLNTPGGSVTGTVETAARVADLARSKHVEAYVAVQCCSAGYYIASQARKITAAPSAIIGSIGVYMAVLDASAAYKQEGYAVQLMKAGKYKAMGAPWKPLTSEETALLQKQVDDIYSRFQSAVTDNRPRVSTDTMQGQWFDGIEAEDRWLVDELTTDNLDERVSSLLLS